MGTMTDNRVFYGPHNCKDCGDLICKASRTQGGESFNYPEGPIYPNTTWVRHNCDLNKATDERMFEIVSGAFEHSTVEMFPLPAGFADTLDWWQG